MPTVCLPQPWAVRVSGRHAERYLNNRLTNNIRALTVDQGCLAAALDAQGKTEGLFVVILESPGTYLLYCYGEENELTVKTLARFIVSEQVTIEPLLNVLLEHTWENSPENTVAEFSVRRRTPTTLLIEHHRLGIRGSDLLSLESSQEKNSPAYFDQLGTFEEFELQRFKTGRPQFPTEIKPGTLFPEPTLPMAVSFQKGCYVGQEVVAKIESRGKSPRVIKRISLAASSSDSTEVTPGVPIMIAHTQSVAGKILSGRVDRETNCFYGFGELKNDAQIFSAHLVVGDVVATLAEK